VSTHYVMILSLPEAVECQYDTSSIWQLFISSAPAREDLKLAIMYSFQQRNYRRRMVRRKAGQWILSPTTKCPVRRRGKFSTGSSGKNRPGPDKRAGKELE